jgi:hypothetical protein
MTTVRRLGLALPATASTQGPTGGSFASDFTLPLTLDIAWTATGPVGSIRGNSHNQCLTNRTEGSAVTQGTNATATGTISGVSGPLTTNFAGMGMQDGTLHAEGAIQPPC